jgi:hypothetical protein
LGAWHQVCGYLGPATPLLNLVMAAAAITQGWRVCVDSAGQFLAHENIKPEVVLINASGFHGQFVSLVLSSYGYA